ncbi:MAG TPA: SCO family protein [Sphingobacteriaceae bacterium]
MRSLIFPAIFALLLASCTQTDKKLPILGPREPVEKVVDGKTVVDTLYQTIPPFRFLNQDSTVITNKDFDGKIYVADFFFTSCTAICPIMHRNMLNVYEEFKGNEEVKLISHSIDSKYDLPYRLKKYSNKLGIEGTQWEFVHGTREEVYGIAQKAYLTSVGEDNNAPGGLIHEGWFVLVDKDKRLRGAYDGTDEKQVEQLIADMHTLLKEYEN